MGERDRRPRINVLAGTNGGGKTSVGGEVLAQSGGEFFNPDEEARRIRSLHPGLTIEHVNSLAWQQGVRLLQRAIAERRDFTFETTLGGDTITGLLETAVAEGIDVRIWYVALASPELHIERVRSRVARGGHDIPDERIRYRYDHSRLNLIRLLPRLTELRVFDNSEEGDPATGAVPKLALVLHMRDGHIVETCDPQLVPDWAKPIMAVALKIA